MDPSSLSRQKPAGRRDKNKQSGWSAGLRAREAGNRATRQTCWASPFGDRRILHCVGHFARLGDPERALRGPDPEGVLAPAGSRNAGDNKPRIAGSLSREQSAEGCPYPPAWNTGPLAPSRNPRTRLSFVGHGRSLTWRRRVSAGFLHPRGSVF